MQQPDAIVPVLQVRNLDFSYGKVQVLFDVGFDVHQGETLALLGTNGAGKSTLLRVISGLGVAERGVVRLRGRTVTYADPELRVRVGIVQLIGGGATFAPLTVRREPARRPRSSTAAGEQDRRIAKAVELFPVLARALRHAAAARPVGGPAADARPGDDARARTRGADHRRAVARTGAGRRPAGARSRAAAARRPASR